MFETFEHTADLGLRVRAASLQVDACCWRIPKSYKPEMRVDGLIFADEPMVEQLRADQAPEQVANVACLPGIQRASLAMPDIHWGYGFCIGGVCATDPNEGGVISPGGFASSFVRRRIVPKENDISARCVRQRILRGATASFSCGRRARSSRRCLAGHGRNE